MQYILDTHILLWWLSNDKKLHDNIRTIITDPKTIVFVSAASIWEIEIKRNIGKLVVGQTINKALIEANDFIELPVTIKHVLSIQELPCHHKDPFDKLLIAQSLAENCVLISEDINMKKYPIKHLHLCT